MKIIMKKVEDLIPYANNPRKNEEAVDYVASSIKNYGFKVPIIIDAKNEIVAGHTRLKAAKKLGLKEVPCIVADDLTPAQIKAFRLIDNKTSEFASWDLEKLKIEIDDEEIKDDLEYFGFKLSEEIGIIKDEIIPDKNIEIEDITRAKEGELWKLGNHLLLCGDSTSENDVKRLVGDKKIDVIFCDPPYNIGLDYSKGINGSKQYSNSKKVYKEDNKKIEDYFDFIDRTIKNALKVAKKDFHIFYWCDEKYIGLFQELFRKNGIDNKRVLLWLKNNFTPTPQVAFNKCYEPCVYGTKGKPKLNKRLLNLDEIMNQKVNFANVMEYMDLWIVNRGNHNDYLHPTQKPVSLYEKPLRRCANKGDNILDLFGGSGTTILASEILGLNAFVIERDPFYCDVIIERWERMTNKIAKKI